MRKAAIGDTTMDTVVSDEIVSNDEINELIDELSRDDIRPPESSTTPPPTLYSEPTTPGSIFYPKRDSELARLVNCDLAMNDLATYRCCRNYFYGYGTCRNAVIKCHKS